MKGDVVFLKMDPRRSIYKMKKNGEPLGIPQPSGDTHNEYCPKCTGELLSDKYDWKFLKAVLLIPRHWTKITLKPAATALKALKLKF